MTQNLAVLAALLTCACGSSSKKLTLLHTNDEHSHHLGFGPEADDFGPHAAAGSGVIKGGAARRAVKLAAERAKARAAGSDVLTVSAGDNSMGTLAQVAFVTQGADYRLMKLLGYDVTTLGNHEFDYGPTPLAGAVAAALRSAEGMPVVVASNIHFGAAPSGPGDPSDLALQAQFDEGNQDKQKPIHRSWVITTPGGLKVGFIGVMGTNAASLAPLKKPTRFSVGAGGDESDFPSALAQLYADLQQVSDSLRITDKVDLVVALSHSGVDLTTPDLGEDTLIAKNVSGIDVIVSGHSHTDYPAQLVTNRATGRQVLVQQAGRFGDHLGRIQLSVEDRKVTFDLAASGLVPIDDTTVGDPAIEGFVSAVLDGLEKTKLPGLGQSFLEYTVSLTYGAKLIHDPNVAGDLAFKPIAKSSFNVDNTAWQKETPLLRLTADADLRTTEALVAPTDLGVQAAGVLRAELQTTKRGEFSFADIFRVVPLGASPGNGSIGYPITRFGILLAELKAAFEVTAGLAYTSETNGDFYLVPSGFCFEYDTDRKIYDTGGALLDASNGRVTKITKASDHTKLDTCDQLIFDANNPALAASGGYAVNPLTLYTVTTNLYVATFAYLARVNLRDPANAARILQPKDAIVYRDPATKRVEIKEWEALGSYLRALSPTGGSGDLPASYKKDAPITRARCRGGLCK